MDKSKRLTTLNSNAIVRGESYLSHYGVKGMKWGKWNSETRRKYTGGLGRASNTMKAKMSSARSSVGKGARYATRLAKSSISASARKAALASARRKEAKRAAKEFKITQKKELAAQRKELGMSRKQYDKLRETTLKSHDPRIVAKGMHTLTDAELNTKLDRLKREEQISRMSTDLSSRTAQARQAKYNAIKANPVVGFGMDYAKKIADKQLGDLGLINVKGDKKKNKGNKGDNGDNGGDGGNGGSGSENDSGSSFRSRYKNSEKTNVPTSTSFNTQSVKSYQYTPSGDYNTSSQFFARKQINGGTNGFDNGLNKITKKNKKN